MIKNFILMITAIKSIICNSLQPFFSSNLHFPLEFSNDHQNFSIFRPPPPPPPPPPETDEVVVVTKVLESSVTEQDKNDVTQDNKFCETTTNATCTAVSGKHQFISRNFLFLTALTRPKACCSLFFRSRQQYDRSNCSLLSLFEKCIRYFMGNNKVPWHRIGSSFLNLSLKK